jgi:hypothetical protein
LSQIKIPNFLSKRKASCKTPQEVTELLTKYKNWVNSEITEEFIKNLEHQVVKKMQDDEKETGFTTRFQFDFNQAHSRGFREALRNVIKQVQYEVI